MNIALWILAALVAIAFALAGIGKLTQPKEKLYAKGMKYVEDFSPQQIKLIGLVELLGAIGLILPPILNIAPILTPIAATGLTITMIIAIFVHIKRREQFVPALVLGILTALLAVGRFWISPF